jgi:DNA (cytosine-5)-methyltransferase 1
MIKHLELFSGIGGFRKAIDLLAKDFGFDTKCIGFSERDKYAIQTYKANFNTLNEVEIGDIEFFASDENKIANLSDFNLLTGGFPCQSFSMMGKQKGLSDPRGNTFYSITNILKVKDKTNFILLENVQRLRTHDKGETFKEILRSLNECGFEFIYYDVFNTSNFDLAQTRNRIFIFGSKLKMPNDFQFSQEEVLKSYNQINQDLSIIKQKSVLDILSKSVDEKYYLSDKIKPTILADGSKKFISKSEINQIIARPLTASMVKMHRACQDNYYSDDFIHSNSPLTYLNKVFTKKELEKHKIRKLTPCEAFSLQGFENEFHDKAKIAGVSNHQLLKQAGNAVSVNTVYAILYHLFIKNNLIYSK